MLPVIIVTRVLSAVVFINPLKPNIPLMGHTVRYLTSIAIKARI